MYDKKGRKSARKDYFRVKKEKFRKEAMLKKEQDQQVAWAKEREKALEAPRGLSIINARKPTKNAPTQAEQDRAEKKSLEALIRNKNPPDFWSSFNGKG